MRIQWKWFSWNVCYAYVPGNCTCTFDTDVQYFKCTFYVCCPKRVHSQVHEWAILLAYFSLLFTINPMLDYWFPDIFLGSICAPHAMHLYISMSVFCRPRKKRALTKSVSKSPMKRRKPNTSSSTTTDEKQTSTSVTTTTETDKSDDQSEGRSKGQSKSKGDVNKEIQGAPPSSQQDLFEEGQFEPGKLSFSLVILSLSPPHFCWGLFLNVFVGPSCTPSKSVAILSLSGQPMVIPDTIPDRSSSLDSVLSHPLLILIFGFWDLEFVSNMQVKLSC